MAEQAQSPGAEEAAPPCPVCLVDILPADTAVLLNCMHVFCIACISRWASLRRECPLCKGHFEAFIHDIVSPSNFKERQLSPLRDTGKGEDGADVLLHDARQQYAAWRLAPSGHRHRSEALHRSSHSRHASNPERRTTPLTEPRPYYYRLQRNLRARDGSAYGAVLPSAPVDAAIEWRRSVYTRGLWAVPTVVPRASAPAPSQATAVATGAERRLQEFVTRELRALLEEQDVVVVKGLVLALLRASGDGSSAAGSDSSGRPADALRPFLHDHAEHFWHELRNFFSSPFSLQTYDRLCRYASPEVAAAAAARPLAVTCEPPAAGSANITAASHQHRVSSGRASRWETSSCSSLQRLQGSQEAGHSHISSRECSSRQRHRGPSRQRQRSIDTPQGQADVLQCGAGTSAGFSERRHAAGSGQSEQHRNSWPRAELDELREQALLASIKQAIGLDQRSLSRRHKKWHRQGSHEPQHRKRNTKRSATLTGVQDSASEDDRWQMN